MLRWVHAPGCRGYRGCSGRPLAELTDCEGCETRDRLNADLGRARELLERCAVFLGSKVWQDAAAGWLDMDLRAFLGWAGTFPVCDVGGMASDRSQGRGIGQEVHRESQAEVEGRQEGHEGLLGQRGGATGSAMPLSATHPRGRGDSGTPTTPPSPGRGGSTPGADPIRYAAECRELLGVLNPKLKEALVISRLKPSKRDYRGKP